LSAQELKTEIESRAEEEASRILGNARGEGEKIVTEAKRKAETLRDERTKTLMRQLDAEETAELAMSRMELRRQFLQAKSEWTNRVFEEAGKRIVEMAQKSKQEYRELLSKLILEGTAKIMRDKFIVEANPRDAEAIKENLKNILEEVQNNKKKKVTLQIMASPTITLGGVIVSTEDRIQYYNNTLEACLSAARQNLAGGLHRVLFKVGE